MPHADFVHLHLHTDYSLLDGACPIECAAEKACEFKMPALAITDHGNLYGAIDFYLKVRDKGIKPIIGCEAYVAPGSRFEKKAAHAGEAAYHLTLLARDDVGYKNLIKLVTAAHLEGFYYKPRIDKELLAAHAKGLIGLSGCLNGEIQDHLRLDQIAAARKAIDEYKNIFEPGAFYLELHNHGIELQQRVTRDQLALAKEFGLPVVATNDVHYVEQSHWHAHDCLVCLGTQAVLADEKRMRYTGQQFYLKSPDEMKALFAEIPQAIRATLEIADQCGLQIQFDKPLYPAYEPSAGLTREQFLRRLCVEGLKKRYSIELNWDGKKIESTGLSGQAAQIVERVKFEMRSIETSHYVSYFLIVWDFIHYAKTHGIPVGPGRGSAAGSLVAYLLEITDIDPLRYNLLFERFLNPDRVSPPDIDIDLSDDRRGEVIEYVRKKYGEQNVAQIITFGTLGAKMVVRDVGRVMGMPYSETDRLAKMIPPGAEMTLKRAMEIVPDFKNEYQTNETVKELIDTARILEGLVRNCSTHAAGVVISDRPLTEIVPLKKDEDGNIITQYSMDPLGKLGLLKIDFLGLKTLTIIQNAVELIEQTRGVKLDIKSIPLDDAKTFDLLNKANTIGLFQLESGGMRDLCRRFGITRIEDIIALIALYRPGPMDLIPSFIARKHGKEKIEYEHPLLEPICAETYGIMIYQEQVMQAASALAGFTLAQADLLRRAMGKKKKEEMDKQREVFVKGCATTNKIPRDKAERIFSLLEKFAGYGFNKSHSAAYGVVAYQTAYLKANYPVEFMAALLSNEVGNSDKLPVILNECHEMGIEVLPPDVNRSSVKFSVEKRVQQPKQNGKQTGQAKEVEVIRYGLVAIKNVGQAAVEAILKARNEGGPFLSVENFCERCDVRSVNRKTLESLIKCGAFDSVAGATAENRGAVRARLFMEIDRALARAATLQRDRERGQSSLFGALHEDSSAGYLKNSATKVTPWTEGEMLGHEKELLGYYVSGHPLAEFADIIARYGTHTVEQCDDLADRALVRVGGIIAEVESKISKRDQRPWAVVKLEDLQEVIEVLVYSDTFDKYCAFLAKGNVVFVSGTIKKDEKAKLTAHEIMPLEHAEAELTKEMYVSLAAGSTDEKKLQQISEILRMHQGRVPVLFNIRTSSGEQVLMDTPDYFHVKPNRQLTQELQKILGEGSVSLKPDKNVRPAPRPDFAKRRDNGVPFDE